MAGCGSCCPLGLGTWPDDSLAEMCVGRERHRVRPVGDLSQVLGGDVGVAVRVAVMDETIDLFFEIGRVEGLSELVQDLVGVLTHVAHRFE